MAKRLVYSKELFERLIMEARRCEPSRHPRLEHNWQRMGNGYPMGEATFEGQMSCGVMTYNMARVLRCEGYRDIKLLRSRQNSGRHLEDHVHLLVNGNTVVDPTWRQFFSIHCQGNPILEKFIYDATPPIFVGNYSQLMTTVNSGIALANIRCKTERESIRRNWVSIRPLASSRSLTRLQDVTEHLELDKLD